jgi:hypothetical protein
MLFEDSVSEIGIQLRSRISQFCNEISMSTSYCSSKGAYRDSELSDSTIFMFDDTKEIYDSSLLSLSWMSDTQRMSGLDVLDPRAGNRKLGQAIIHLFDCVAKIRTHVGRLTLLDTGAIESSFGLIEVLNTDKRRGGLERGCKIKEAACYALWSILEDFPEGQAACFR